MLFCEIYTRRGVHTPQRLRELALRLTLDQLLGYYVAAQGANADEAASANPGVVAMLGDLNHVVVHEIDTWIAGGHPVDAARPRYLVRYYVPGPWRAGLSEFLITATTAAVVDIVGRSPDARVEVQVLPIPEGSYGLDGKVTGESRLMQLIDEAKTETDAAAVPNAFIDPVCNMVATDPTLTLEHDGVTYGFCSAGCRKYYAEKLRAGAAE